MAGPTRVLFICSANCLRSQMAEAMLRYVGGDRFVAFSAGSHPAGYVHPMVFETLEEMNVPVGEQYSKSWEEFLDEPIDVVITVCDGAAQQICQTWPGNAVMAHWPLPDPVTHPIDNQDRTSFGRIVAERLMAKIQILVALPVESLSAGQLKQELDRIGMI